MVTRKEDTSKRVARRKYEEKNKELRKEKNANFQTMIPRDLFEEINAFFANTAYTPPSLKERFETLMRQVALMHKYKDPRNAILEARKHTAWYMQGLKGAAELRRLCKRFDYLVYLLNGHFGTFDIVCPTGFLRAGARKLVVSIYNRFDERTSELIFVQGCNKLRYSPRTPHPCR